MGKTRILGLGGSLREGSLTKASIQIALEAASQAGAAVELFDLRENPLPFYDDRKEIESYTANVKTLLEKIRLANGLILGTPVYHGTLSGSMKNALDFLELLANDNPPWLSGKVVGLISVAGGNSGTNAINGMINTCQTLRAWVVPMNVVVFGHQIDERGHPIDTNLTERLERLGRLVATGASALAESKF